MKSFWCFRTDTRVDCVVIYHMAEAQKMIQLTYAKSLSKERSEAPTDCDTNLMDASEQEVMMRDSELKDSNSSAYEEFEDLLDA